MDKKYLAFFSLLIILAFIGYIIYDTAGSGEDTRIEPVSTNQEILQDKWFVENELQCEDGDLTTVAVSAEGSVYIGGNSFITCYDKDLKKQWTKKTNGNINSLAVRGDSIFAATNDLILLYDVTGNLVEEWGPFEDNSIITSVAAGKNSIAFSDAGNKLVFVLGLDGRMKSMIGQSGEKFIIPSPYFDVAIDESENLFIANTGHRRIESRSIDGEIKGYFGTAGTAPGSFCGCCNPSHFILIPAGYVTAEKGLNRIKILDRNGDFSEWVSANNNFVSSMPLDLASSDGNTIYAANPADSKVYIYKRKDQ